ncbi:microneme protein MIC13 [Besnoitia besnoiti]|uniref:Microneme protein MIC13 n=1 Tax=Besnoitia besnoiti TaxID=94643 RepID=A0A2A9LYC5_BESBE|nr:microneme protein MIC13 [Besnoitia besnoiti]PFH31448.1 microneme protein MIC13 [Besnoitia besnoiti]
MVRVAEMRLARRAAAAATACAAVAAVVSLNDAVAPVAVAGLLHAEEGEPMDPGKPTPSTSSELQRYLDGICMEKFAKLCSEGKGMYCATDVAVARKGKGTAEQTEFEWRCYDDRRLGTDRSDVQCTDNCGVLFNCRGSVNAAASVHTTVPELGLEVLNKASEFCSPQQQLLNNYCDNIHGGWVARRGVLSANDSDKRWSCYDTNKLEYRLHSECVDNCGRSHSCPGGRTGPDRANLDENVDYALIPEAASLIGSELPCEKSLVCVATLHNPPRCVSISDADVVMREEREEQEKEKEDVLKEDARKAAAVRGGGEAPPQDKRLPEPQFHIPRKDELGQTDADVASVASLQGLLNLKCAREFRWLCKTQKIDEFCVDEAVVARKDYGVYADTAAPIWRCMYENSMDSDLLSICVDDCGQLMTCEGGIDPTKVVHARWEALEIVAKTRKVDFCSGATQARLSEA